MKSFFTLLLFTLVQLSICAQATIKVQPYLQNASPTSIHILWETTEDSESIVEWGLTQALGNTTIGTAMTNSGTAQVHDVFIEGLNRFTQYYYRVQTGSAVSDIYTFKTPPFASDKESFSLVAMSDMQLDGSNPEKFTEIVQDGIIPYVQSQYGTDLSQSLAMVMIPGDLVVTGNIYSQWEEHFFTPIAPLLNYVPLYPVPGNHELNSDYFFNYFNLPDNGSATDQEHWWYKDYGNLRIIGLDSNNPYATNPVQFEWIDAVLADACASDSIDFVFAEMHHPHKSELWLPGESGFTTAIVERLENFTTDCGKPSVHFFGHTHGYSRGQSQDHQHLMVNVATAGGAIDHWGEFPNADYEEFTVSQDEWGFVTVDVTAGDDAAFTLKRISRGNETTFRNNEIRDSITVYLNSEAPQTPETIFPKDEIVSPDCVVLLANDFSSPSTSAAHGASQWQVSTVCNDFSNPVFDSWQNHENWYFDVDTQADDDLRDEIVTNLSENTDYCWRVRYRDRSLNWSEWSAPTNFSTSESQNGTNLLINPGAEAATTGWTVLAGNLEALTDGECDGITPNSGLYLFAVGGVCDDAPFGKCEQLINVSSESDAIDAGEIQVNFGGFLSNWGGSDLPAFQLYFLDENAMLIDSTDIFSTLSSSWTEFDEWSVIPVGTRIISFTLTGTRNAGADNDSYFDDLFLRLGNPVMDCSEFMVNTTEQARYPMELFVNPNPFNKQAHITLPIPAVEIDQVHIQDVNGRSVVCPIKKEGQQIILGRADLSSGIYFFTLSIKNQIFGKGKFVVID